MFIVFRSLIDHAWIRAYDIWSPGTVTGVIFHLFPTVAGALKRPIVVIAVYVPNSLKADPYPQLSQPIEHQSHENFQHLKYVSDIQDVDKVCI